MNCPNCGTQNSVGFKFCTKCGQNLEQKQVPTETATNSNENTQVSGENNITTELNNANATLMQNQINIQPNIQTNTIVNTNNTNNTLSIKFVEYFTIILAVILKPFSAMKTELVKLEDMKNSVLMSLIVSGVGTILNLITKMLNAVRVKSLDWTTGEFKTTWVWENLKNLKYVDLIGKTFLLYIGIIAGIAVIYFLCGLIMKKSPKFPRFLAASSLAIVPILISTLVLAPILSMISNDIGLIVTILGVVYTLVLLYESMNNELSLEGNVKYYANIACLSIIMILLYYIIYNLIVSSITSSLGDFSNLLG